jgi:hypothetical protein
LAFSVISRRRCSQRDRRSPNALEALADEMGVLVIEARRALAIDLGQRRSDGVADTEALKEAESGAHNLFNLRVFISLGKAAMDHSEARDFKSRFRRYDAKRRRVEAAVEGLVHRYGLPSDTARALNDWIYRLYRILLVLKSLDIKIGTIGSGNTPPGTLRNGPQMHAIPRFQHMSPMRESSRRI